MQSAYRRFHSTETAVKKVVNVLLLAVAGRQMLALCLLNLTAAFDTVDHELLLLRLERHFGLRGIVLEWFLSYLSGRTFRVVFSDCTSSVIYIICSVPQGSLLGPLLFIVYTSDIPAIAEQHDVFLHAFADDTQLYLHCRRADTASSVARLERCITDIGHWMSANRLKLNTDKTELLWVGSRHSLSHQDCCPPVLQLGPDSVLRSSSRLRPSVGSNAVVRSVPRLTCLRRQRVQFLLVTSTPVFSAFSGHGVGGHTRALVCRVTRR